MAQNPYEKYLTGADIEKVTGMKGINLIPREPSPRRLEISILQMLQAN